MKTKPADDGVSRYGVNEFSTLPGMCVKAMRQPWSSGIALLIGDQQNHVTNIEMYHYEVGRETKPTLSIGFTAAQELMDDLWQCGLRPSEGTGSAGAMRAVERHLEDMRRLVFQDKSGKSG